MRTYDFWVYQPRPDPEPWSIHFYLWAKGRKSGYDLVFYSEKIGSEKDYRDTAGSDDIEDYNSLSNEFENLLARYGYSLELPERQELNKAYIKATNWRKASS